MAHPTVLRKLVARYEELTAAASASAPDPALTRQREDTAYTLCVSTGTRDVQDALRVARRALEAGGGSSSTTAPSATATSPTDCTA
ncbi:DUF5133 domain-containing protein [Streptomyces sp. NPDC003036]|uniref:DUF5133 domain-containing protein n=1 Tax=Streptomyces sp. NPDC003036 TaxID=3154442 RepID=UPI0033A3AD00